MSNLTPNSQDFDHDILSASGGAASQEELRGIITSIARASHDIADLVSLGRLAQPDASALSDRSDATGPVSSARQILVNHLEKSRVKELSCVGENAITLDDDGIYTVTIDPLEGIADADANLPFGTIFSITSSATMVAAGFIHYGPQTNLVLALGAGVHIFNLDRATRTYRLAAENLRIPDSTREWSIDVTKRRRWPSSIRALIDEELEEADALGSIRADVRWTGSLTADAYRILRRGGAYLCPLDEQIGVEESCPDFRHATYPVAFIIEQAGGRATTGYERIGDCAERGDRNPTPLIFGSPGIVERIERLHALPENLFGVSPLFQKRGLFRA